MGTQKKKRAFDSRGSLGWSSLFKGWETKLKTVFRMGTGSGQDCPKADYEAWLVTALSLACRVGSWFSDPWSSLQQPHHRGWTWLEQRLTCPYSHIWIKGNVHALRLLTSTNETL